MRVLRPGRIHFFGLDCSARCLLGGWEEGGLRFVCDSLLYWTADCKLGGRDVKNKEKKKKKKKRARLRELRWWVPDCVGRVWLGWVVSWLGWMWFCLELFERIDCMGWDVGWCFTFVVGGVEGRGASGLGFGGVGGLGAWGLDDDRIPSGGLRCEGVVCRGDMDGIMDRQGSMYIRMILYSKTRSPSRFLARLERIPLQPTPWT